MWYHFGNQDETRNFDLIELYKNHFVGKTINAYNLSLFIDSFLKRTDLAIDRSDLNKNFKCSILLIVGSLSPHLQDSIDMNSRINPATSTWLKLQNCGMVLEEYPDKVTEALKLFIQGLGYSLASYDRQRNLIKNNLDQMNDYQMLNHQFQHNNNLQNYSLGDNISDGDKCANIEKIDYEPANKDGHIIENPIERC